MLGAGFHLAGFYAAVVFGCLGVFMRSRWLLGSLAVAVSAGLLAWSPVVVAQTGPVCRQGCPCGNTCIDCSDTCRIGDGSASGGSDGRESPGQDVGQAVVVLLALGVAMVVVPLAVGWLMTSLRPSEPTRPRSKGKRTQSTDRNNDDKPNGDDWFRQTQRAISEANAATAVR